jgi:hypothetical protein
MPRRRPVRLAQSEPRPLVPAEALARLGELSEKEMWGTQLPHPAHGPIEARPRDAGGAIPAYDVHSPQEIDEEGLEPPEGLRPGPGAPLRDPAPGAPADGLSTQGALTGAGPSSAAKPANISAPAARHDGLTAERQRIFLETLAATGSVSRAAKACGLSKQALYAHRNRADVPAFREAWEVALSCAINRLGDIAFERAIDGVEEPVFWKGEQIGTRRRYNDNLLVALLRARDPFAFCPPSELRHFRTVRHYNTRPRLPGALEDVAREAAGMGSSPRYDDDPGGPLDP